METFKRYKTEHHDRTWRVNSAIHFKLFFFIQQRIVYISEKALDQKQMNNKKDFKKRPLYAVCTVPGTGLSCGYLSDDDGEGGGAGQLWIINQGQPKNQPTNQQTILTKCSHFSPHNSGIRTCPFRFKLIDLGMSQLKTAKNKKRYMFFYKIYKITDLFSFYKILIFCIGLMAGVSPYMLWGT